MPKFSVKFEERHNVVVSADSADEAIEKVQDGEYNDEDDNVELTLEPEAEELDPEFNPDDEDENVEDSGSVDTGGEEEKEDENA